MNLEQMLRAKPINASGEKEFEEKKITKPNKDDLDKAIARESKEGWLVKSRSHQAEGLHGVMLVRRKVERVWSRHFIIPAPAPAYRPPDYPPYRPPDFHYCDPKNAKKPPRKVA